jgi:Arc/MetJ-type ribon-helix-helix transcriptional regulator
MPLAASGVNAAIAESVITVDPGRRACRLRTKCFGKRVREVAVTRRGAGTWFECGQDWGVASTVMETIQIVLEKDLLQATDRAARRRRLNRSALVREALRAHLRRLEILDRERRDRAGYLAAGDAESVGWDRVTAWPDE